MGYYLWMLLNFDSDTDSSFSPASNTSTSVLTPVGVKLYNKIVFVLQYILFATVRHK